jgi:acyl carrier protein
VKIRGLRVELGEIEHVLAGYPGVRQATVVVKGLGTPQARLIGYFVPDTGMELAPSEIRDYLAAALPAHMVPAALLCLDEMPLTPIGKLDPARLPEPETAASDRAELSTVTQRRLAGIWSGLLELDADQLGPVDNFFVVGGNSLQVTRLISRIRDTFQVTLQPRDLFTSPVLEQLADQIDKAVGKTSDSATEAQLEAEIAELSEADLDRLLAEGGLQ